MYTQFAKLLNVEVDIFNTAMYNRGYQIILEYIYITDRELLHLIYANTF